MWFFKKSKTMAIFVIVLYDCMQSLSKRQLTDLLFSTTINIKANGRVDIHNMEYRVPCKEPEHSVEQLFEFCQDFCRITTLNNFFSFIFTHLVLTFTL